jgi:hypothetical protein
MRFKGWRLTAYGDVRAVERAFSVDAVSAVLLASSSAFGHHEPAVTGGRRTSPDEMDTATN